MSGDSELIVERADAYVITRRSGLAAVPVVFDSPHSGTLLPPDTETIATRAALHSGWDAWVDELWASAPLHGCVLLAATFHRMYIDVNRARDDIDPELLSEPWPGGSQVSDACRRGMGLVRRLALPHEPMYDRQLSVDEVRRRIERYYDPYHDALGRLLDSAYERWGRVWHIDCHSMKSTGNLMNVDAGASRPDFVVSDRDGTSADPTFTRWVADRIADMGYSVTVNEPYRGAELIRRFSDPAAGRHSIQIEINRRLYMNEKTVTKSPGFAALRSDLEQLAQRLARHVQAQLN
jgi:N-formylglutamate deformylase